MWDNQPLDRVMLDYLFVRVIQKQQQKEMTKQKKEMDTRYNARSNNKGGRPLRTTSDAAELDDFFDRTNTELRGEVSGGMGSNE